MKTKSIILFLALGLVFTACSRDEENFFNQTAAQRTEQALTNAFDILTAPENGWEMLYFANPYNAGYTVLVKFDKHGKVIAASRNPQTTKNVYKEDGNSTWEVMSDYGPILTFNTYNEVMHAWADPQEDGDGYLGDYEFLILEATPNLVRLKGKKHSGYCEMRPLDKNMDWQAYFDEVYKLRDLLVTKNDGAEFNYISSSGTETMVYDDGMMIVNLEEGIIYPFTIRPNSITFYGSGIPAQGETFAKNFVVNDTKDALVCTDSGISARFVPSLTLAEVLNVKLDHHIEWTINKSDMGSASKTTYNTISTAVKNSGGSLISMKLQRVDSMKIVDEIDTIRYTVDRLNIEFDGSNGRSQAFFVMNFQLNDTELTYTYKYPSGEPGAAQVANEFLQRAGGGAGKEDVGLQRLKDLVEGTFKVSSASG